MSQNGTAGQSPMSLQSGPWAGSCPARRVDRGPWSRNPARAYNLGMTVSLRSYDPHDFAALHRLDQACFPVGISYSKITLHYFLTISSADCIVAADDKRIAGFILTEENPPLAHVITLDVAEAYRGQGVGSALLVESERNLGLRGVRSILLETAVENEAAVAFWKKHGYRIEAVLKRYYLGRLDAYEMGKRLLAPPPITP